ncbi:hypothetical protein [Nonomuraea wenchangensis]|uniref:Uncharacterized protein n=1 Tax=Nonomuraea wenchangensis TaxID=568860 RepID=A0A1I0ERL3_9ACTN|nr:hypothetical protein [Nonomuraea wenchangensis]SET48053.1 hypothetical protein SAMN05421811_103173 [Nonomuraea wenchangensis]
MALTQDGWFNSTMVAALSNTIALNLADTTPGAFKGALYEESASPNFSQANPAYGTSPLNSGESSGPGYTAGGADLTVVSFAELGSAANKIGWKLGSVTWTESTIDAAGILIYVPSLSSRAVLMRFFGQTYSTADGSYTLSWHSDGVWRQVLRNTA